MWVRKRTQCRYGSVLNGTRLGLDTCHCLVYTKLSKKAHTTARKRVTKMNIIIKSDSTSEHGRRSLEFIIGKKEIYVSVLKNEVNVLVKNASHKAYRGMGKFFTSFDDAINNYKSVEVKRAITCVYEMTQGQSVKVIN